LFLASNLPTPPFVYQEHAMNDSPTGLSLDQALEEYRDNPENPDVQSRFYDLVLNTVFFLPLHPETEPPAAEGEEQSQGFPLVLESDGDDYLLLFDSEQRLQDWAQQPVPFMKAPGYLLAEQSQAPLHWALNVGTDFSKTFVPDEIAWLAEVVQQCQQADAADED
jgi:hypothetical protein